MRKVIGAINIYRVKNVRTNSHEVSNRDGQGYQSIDLSSFKNIRT
jgi:uncharacterized protein YjhX (UPF0386 family)